MLTSLRKLLPYSQGRIPIIWAAHIMAVPMVIVLDKRFGRPSHSSIEGWDWAVVAMVIYSLWVMYWVRTRFRNSQVKRGQPPIPPEKKWELIQIITFAAALGIAFWSFFARVAFESPVWFSYLLYGLAIVLLLVFEPKQPPAPVSGNELQNRQGDKQS
jgi:hypothetical protein